MTKCAGYLLSLCLFLSFCDPDLCISLWSGGPGCLGSFVQEGSLRQLCPGFPSSARGAEAFEPLAGEAHEEARTACLPLQIYCKTTKYTLTSITALDLT